MLYYVFRSQVEYGIVCFISLRKNILIDFKAKMFPFILSTNFFQEILSDLDSTVKNTLNLRKFSFSYRYPVLTLPTTHK